MWGGHYTGGILRAVATGNLMASKILGYSPMLTPGKVNELRHPDWVCDNTEISRDTGWQPLVSLENGLSSILRGTPLKIDRGITNVT